MNQLHPLPLKRVVYAVLVLGLLAMAGCAPSLKVRVESAASSNGGRPFYFMVRSVDANQFLAEDYEGAAGRVFKFPADPSVLGSETIFPGQPSSATVDTEDGKDVIIYFFFTTPGQKWKVPLHRPLPSEVVVELGRTQIKRVLVRKR